MRSFLIALIISLFALPALAAFQIPNYTVPASGAPVSYMVISRVSLNPIQQNIQVSVGEYATQAAFNAGLQPVTTQNFTINGATYQTFLSSLTASDIPSGTTQGVVVSEMIGALQTNMLTLPFFANATIVP